MKKRWKEGIKNVKQTELKGRKKKMEKRMIVWLKVRKIEDRDNKEMEKRKKEREMREINIEIGMRKKERKRKWKWER